MIERNSYATKAMNSAVTYAKEEKVRPNPKSPIMDVYYIMVDPISYGVTAGESYTEMRSD